MIKLQADQQYVEIDIISRNHPNSNDYWDGNWLEVEIRINSTGFKALYGTNLRTDELQQFYNDLIQLKENRVNRVEFITMEEGIYLYGEVHVSGSIKWKIVAKDSPGESNSLTFFIETDNSSIENLISQLSETLKKYPVIGNIA